MASPFTVTGDELAGVRDALNRSVADAAELRRVLGECVRSLECVVEWMDANGYRPDDQSFGARDALAAVEKLK